MAVKRRRAEAAKDAAVCRITLITVTLISTYPCTDIGPFLERICRYPCQTCQ